ncbi:MAG: methylated-DNA--[protein]-cysteine S-methyltransferase [Candidatus Omnitrophica bacterium]|nr:methylated-DNA--[protein]-cysteine S-methyltransferase [Candidatus Omnitrophota bacterium]
MLKPAIFVDHVKTPLGTFQIVATRYGLREVHFPHKAVIPRLERGIQRLDSRRSDRTVPDDRAADRRLTDRPVRGNDKEVRSIFKKAKSYLNSFLAGEKNYKKAVSVDWTNFKPFDRRVLKTLVNQTKTGQTISYSELAKRCGKPRAQRAVGNALNRNPIPILIPCHRVLRKDQSLGGYRGGLRWKRTLLELEKSFES